MNSAGSKRNTHRRSSSAGLLLDAIFGKKVSQDTVLDDSVSEETLSKAIDFKIEQERTKQQYYRLENTNKFIDLLKLSGSLGLPLDQLLMLLGSYNTTGSGNSSSNSNSGIGDNDNNYNNSVYYPDQTTQLSNRTQQQQQTTYRFPPVNASLNSSPNRSKKLNAVPSLGYYHRRVNSPARIGANAVASLSRNRSPAMIKEEEGSSQDMVSTPTTATSANPGGPLNVFSPLTGKNFNSFPSPNVIARTAPSTVSSTSPNTRSYYASTVTEYPPQRKAENAEIEGQSNTEFPCTKEVKGQDFSPELQSGKIAPVSNTSTLLLPSFSHLAATNAKHYGITKPFTPRGNHHRSRSLSSPSYYSFSSNSGTEITQHHGSGSSVESTPVMSKPSFNVIDLDAVKRAQDSTHTPGRRSRLSKSTTLNDNKKE